LDNGVPSSIFASDAIVALTTLLYGGGG